MRVRTGRSGGAEREDRAPGATRAAGAAGETRRWGGFAGPGGAGAASGGARCGVSGWWRDAGLAVAGLGVSGFWAYRIADSWGAGYAVAGLVAAVVVCGLVVFRRRHRAGFAGAGLVVAAVAIGVAWAAGLPSEPGPGLAFGLCALVGSAVAGSPGRTAGVVAAGGLAVAVGSLFTAHVPGVPPVLVLNGAGWLVAVGYGGGVRLLAARRRAVAARVRGDERRRLARELHDVVGHHLTGIVLRSQAAQVLARRGSGPDTEVLTGFESAGTEALTALRQVVGLLREDDGPVVTAGLAELVDGFGHPGARLRVAEGEEDAWPPEVAATVHRVVQEALTNVARHAPRARTVTVDVSRSDPGELTVTVTDDGPPGGPYRMGNGLTGMRERAEALGGRADAGPGPGGGWTVRAVLPVRAVR